LGAGAVGFLCSTTMLAILIARTAFAPVIDPGDSGDPPPCAAKCVEPPRGKKCEAAILEYIATGCASSCSDNDKARVLQLGAEHCENDEGEGDEPLICDWESDSAGPASLAAQQCHASMTQECRDYLGGLGGKLGDLSTVCSCYKAADEAEARAATCAPTAGARTVAQVYESCVNPPPACYDEPCSGTCPAAVANSAWWESLSPTCRGLMSSDGLDDWQSLCRCYTSGVSAVGATCSGLGSIPGAGTTEEIYEACLATMPGDEGDEGDSSSRDGPCCVEHMFSEAGAVEWTTCYGGRSPWEASTMTDLCTAGHSEAGAAAPTFRDCSQSALDAGSCGSAGACAECSAFDIPTGKYFANVGYTSCPESVVSAVLYEGANGGQCQEPFRAGDDEEEPPPPCIQTCTAPPESCAEYLTMITDGCASTCDDILKAGFGASIGCLPDGSPAPSGDCSCYEANGAFTSPLAFCYDPAGCWATSEESLPTLLEAREITSLQDYDCSSYATEGRTAFYHVKFCYEAYKCYAYNGAGSPELLGDASCPAPAP